MNETQAHNYLALQGAVTATNAAEVARAAYTLLKRRDGHLDHYYRLVREAVKYGADRAILDRAEKIRREYA